MESINFPNFEFTSNFLLDIHWYFYNFVYHGICNSNETEQNQNSSFNKNSGIFPNFKKEFLNLKLFQVKTTAAWRKIREEHCSLLNLCRILDKTISNLVLLSFSGNLYFVLVQLFNALRPMNDVLQKTYFFLSFGFLIFRIIFVSLRAAAMNDECRKILIQLLAIPSELYNLEVIFLNDVFDLTRYFRLNALFIKLLIKKQRFLEKTSL